MNIFSYEVRQYRRAFVYWSLGLAALICVYMPFMPAFTQEAAAVKTFFASLGPMVLGAIGIDTDLFFGALGFYGFVITFVHLIGAIQASSLGLSLFAKEAKAADFLLTKPKSRGGIFRQKLLSAACCLLATQLLFYCVSTCIMLLTAKEGVQIMPFLWITLSLTFVQLMFVSAGIAAAVLFPRIKSVTPLAIGISGGCFMLGMIANMTDSEALRHFAVFRYFDANHILMHGGYETKYLLLSLSLSAVLLFLSAAVFMKKDMRAA